MDDLEAIRRLKARYFRLMDTQQWEAWGECFTEDVVLETTPTPGEQFVGRDEVVRRVSAVLADAVTVHHGHMPEIEILDADRASGIWAMEDRVELPGLSLRGFGHYHDDYARTPDGWRIRRSRLTRLRLDVERKPGGPAD